MLGGQAAPAGLSRAVAPWHEPLAPGTPDAVANPPLPLRGVRIGEASHPGPEPGDAAAGGKAKGGAVGGTGAAGVGAGGS